MSSADADTLAILRCAHGVARLSREEMAKLLTAQELADEGPADVGYRLAHLPQHQALGLGLEAGQHA